MASTASGEGAAPAVKDYELKEMTELRMEAPKAADVFITLKSGTAEVFGAELQLGQKQNVRGQKLAVFTFDGCRVQVEGSPDVIYAADETPMVAYINTHQVISNLRSAAKQAGGQGPRVVIVGPVDSGKSTLSRMLLNWAVRMGNHPTYVDLDVGQGSITAPGSIAATPIEVPIDVEEGYPVQVPLVYFFGHASPSDNLDLYQFLVDRIASVLERRSESSPEVAAAGLVVNTLGWIDGAGYDLMLHLVASLRADVVVVMEQDRLYSQLTGALKGATGAMGRPVQVVKLYKSGGVVARTPQLRKETRTSRVKEYFYGPRANLLPHSQTVLAETLLVFRIGGGFRAPSTALPLGAVSKADPMKVTPVAVTNELVHSLLGVSHAATPDQVLSSNIAGFIYVTDVDVARGTVTYLAPCAGPLPGRYLVMGSLKVVMD